MSPGNQWPEDGPLAPDANALRVPEKRNVRPVAPLEGDVRATAGGQVVPRAVRRTEDRDIRLAVAVVVTWNRDVRPIPPLRDEIPAARQGNVPRAVRRAEDADVGLPIAVVVAGHRDVRAIAPLEGDERSTAG